MDGLTPPRLLPTKTETALAAAGNFTAVVAGADPTTCSAFSEVLARLKAAQKREGNANG
jgi:hypothetical protein